ncbi:MAG TPA: 2'-5' RNA ligase family protein, partial [bacterium]|nr:2'-5' RNA ligase family protein [bacterium]
MADRKGAKGGQGRDKLRPRRSAEFGFSEEAKRPPEQTEEAGRAKGAPGHGPAKGVPRPGGSKKGPKPRSASLPRSGPGYNEAMETLPRDLAEPAAPIPPEEVSRGSEARPTEGRGGEGSEGRRRPRYEQPSGTLRLFAAAPLPLTLKRDLVFYQTALLKNPRQLKVVKPENLHITLHFLGDTPLEQIDAFKASLTEVAAAQAPFRIEIGGAAAFPGSIVIPVVGGRVELVAMGMALRNTAA